VTILRRTCWRTGKTSSAVSSRPASAGPIARIFARRLSSPQGRLSRHLFFFFFLFFVSAEKGAVLSLRLLSFAFFGLRLRRFHFKFKLCGHVVMQLDRHFVFAGILDRTLEYNFVTVDLQTELVLH